MKKSDPLPPRSKWPFRWRPGFVIEHEDRLERDFKEKLEIESMRKKRKEEDEKLASLLELAKRENEKFQEEFKDFKKVMGSSTTFTTKEDHLIIMLADDFCRTMSSVDHFADLEKFIFYRKDFEHGKYPYDTGSPNSNLRDRYWFDLRLKKLDFIHLNLQNRSWDDRHVTLMESPNIRFHGHWESMVIYMDVDYKNFCVKDIRVNFASAICMMDLILNVCERLVKEKQHSKIDLLMNKIEDKLSMRKEIQALNVEFDPRFPPESTLPLEKIIE